VPFDRVVPQRPDRDARGVGYVCRSHQFRLRGAIHFDLLTPESLNFKRWELRALTSCLRCLRFKRSEHRLAAVSTPDPSAFAAVENQQYACELRKTLPPEAADISINNLALRRARHESWEKRFGEVVRGWRLDRNWSQEEVAEKLAYEGFEMHQTTVAKIERGSRPLRVAEAAALAAVFRMPVMAVFELSLPDDVPWWSGSTEPGVVQERQELLQRARENSDRAREDLYSAAQTHAALLAEVEKLVLAMNDAAAKEGHDGSEA
jgi:transcriptional regulator with XRE-family HTH domain